MNRRSLMHLLLSLSGLSAIATLLPYGEFLSGQNKPKVERTKITNRSQLQQNPAKNFLWPTEIRPFDTNILIRRDSGSLHAFNRICTHLQCLVNYEAQTHQLVCPCHGSRFKSEDGTVVNGPATNPLPIIKVEEDEKGDIYAVGIEGEFGYGRKR